MGSPTTARLPTPRLSPLPTLLPTPLLLPVPSTMPLPLSMPLLSSAPLPSSTPLPWSMPPSTLPPCTVELDKCPTSLCPSLTRASTGPPPSPLNGAHSRKGLAVVGHGALLG